MQFGQNQSNNLMIRPTKNPMKLKLIASCTLAGDSWVQLSFLCDVYNLSLLVSHISCMGIWMNIHI